MPRTPKGTVSKRERHAAIKLLAAVVDDPAAALYLKVQSARSLLQVKPEPKPAEDDDFPDGDAPATHTVVIENGQEFVRIEGKSGFVIQLPSNGRKGIAEHRQRERLERLAELAIPEEEPEALPAPEPIKPSRNRKALARAIRERRKAQS